VGVLLEEAAFFEGEGFVVNDDEIFRAAIPRLIPDGQIVFASTPWAQAGKLWELYRDNFGHPEHAVVCKASTLFVNPGENTERDYNAELARDPDNAHREWDAEFLSGDSERFFPEVVIEQCIDKTLVVPNQVRNGEHVRFGGDFAFASDSSALFGFVERGDLLITCELDELRPVEGMPLVPSQVVRRFAERMQRCGAKLLVADDHYRQAIEEDLSRASIALASVGQTPAHSFVLARSLMAQGRVKIPAHARLLAQLRRVRATQKPGGVISIHQPRAKEGGHGDLVSALVCALSGVTVTSAFPREAPRGRHEALSQAEEEAIVKRLKANEKRVRDQNRGVLGLARRFAEKRWQALAKR
jgi:hypothetical protein